jgi:hypothetical protein
LKEEDMSASAAWHSLQRIYLFIQQQQQQVLHYSRYVHFLSQLHSVNKSQSRKQFNSQVAIAKKKLNFAFGIQKWLTKVEFHK